MPRNMSFMHTKAQCWDYSKRVTRRNGWDHLKIDEIIQQCEQCQGIKAGGLIRIHLIKIDYMWREELRRMVLDKKYGKREATLEGFPDWSGAEFVDFYCYEMGVNERYCPNRIEFTYTV